MLLYLYVEFLSVMAYYPRSSGHRYIVIGASPTYVRTKSALSSLSWYRTPRFLRHSLLRSSKNRASTGRVGRCRHTFESIDQRTEAGRGRVRAVVRHVHAVQTTIQQEIEIAVVNIGFATGGHSEHTRRQHVVSLYRVRTTFDLVARITSLVGQGMHNQILYRKETPRKLWLRCHARGIDLELILS